MGNKVFWLTGLSGAGKTTIGREFYKRLKSNDRNVVFLDGDELRQVFGNDLGYNREDRLKCAMRYARLCKMLWEQGMMVICCTISMFDEVRKWNRENIEGYIEVYIKVPIKILNMRNQKGIYSGVKDGTVEDVVGVDLELELPKYPNIILENIGNQTVDKMVNILLTTKW